MVYSPSGNFYMLKPILEAYLFCNLLPNSKLYTFLLYVCGDLSKSIIPVTVVLLSDELSLTFPFKYLNSSFKLLDEVMCDSSTYFLILSSVLIILSITIVILLSTFFMLLSAQILFVAEELYWGDPNPCICLPLLSNDVSNVIGFDNFPPVFFFYLERLHSNI